MQRHEYPKNQRQTKGLPETVSGSLEAVYGRRKIQDGRVCRKRVLGLNIGDNRQICPQITLRAARALILCVAHNPGWLKTMASKR
jgi:hypothetical protein